MRFQVFVMRKERVGPFWNRRTEFIRLEPNVLSTKDERAALDYANEYPIWANEAVIVSDLGVELNYVGDGRWIYIKRGSKY